MAQFSISLDGSSDSQSSGDAVGSIFPPLTALGNLTYPRRGPVAG
jgi:hypothetical protein